MKANLTILVRVLAVFAILAAIPFALPSAAAPALPTVESLGMFSVAKWNIHYRAPNIEQIETLLEKAGIPMKDAAAVDQAVATFRKMWAERNPTTPDPVKLQKLLDKERNGQLGAAAASVAAEPQIMSLAVPVEFPPTPETFNDGCGNPVTFAGPAHNEVPAPGPRDNNTLWYDDTTPTLYDELYFGVGPDAGVILHHPNLGTIDLRGSTMANYYLEQSGGQFTPKGLVYPKWLVAQHSEAWYGADNCSGSNHNVLAGDLVREVVDAVNADNPDFAWQDYDGDGDGVVDNFTVIHAGMGQESGGGAQGSFSIWSHASAIDFPSGKLACAAGSPGCPDRDIYVRSYSMDPEMIDTGVIAEEFGHAAFGLPDIYTTDAQASPSNWTIMEAGSWNGPVGGMMPAPFPLFFRYLIGWANPVELDYTTGPTFAKVGQLSQPTEAQVQANSADHHPPAQTEDGIKVNLPDQVVTTENLAGTGQAWWSDRADLADFYLAHDFDLTPATAPVFSFNSFWSFEEDYDYGYFEVSDDGGATWAKLQDTSGFMVLDNAGKGVDYGLNGEGSGNLVFDLSAYAGKSITLRLHYTSDVGVQWAGWQADDFLLMDGATELFKDDVEAGADGWTTNHFVFVPLTRIYPMYYLAEWRNSSGFDKGLKYPYTTIYNNDATNEWEVDRCEYTVPGMLLWLRNAAKDFDYTLTDSLYDPPSWGTQHALLVVDSHYWPLEWDAMSSNADGLTGAHIRLNSRCQPGNSTFTLQPTTGYTVRRSNAAGVILETKTFEPLPAVSQFHDSLGYYPGFRYHLPAFADDPNEGLWWWDAVASAVVPAKASYTTRITWDDKTPATDLYGWDIGTVLGTGNPGANGVQYGLHLAVVDKAKDGSWGKIAVWNSPALTTLEKKVNRSKSFAGNILMYQLKVKNLTPISQKFVVTDPIPEGTEFLWGGRYDKATNTVTWKGTVRPNGVAVAHIWVRVKRDVAAGTEIVNTATLTDDALGGSASATTTVMQAPPHHGHRHDVPALGESVTRGE
jgi:immune inhibitor A